MEKEYRMSAARAQELQEELNYLKTTRSDEVAEQIKVARGFGDLSENSEYDEAKNEQGKLYSRIAELEEILQHVVIVDESNAPTSRSMWMATLGITSRSRSMLTRRLRMASPSRTITRPATDSGRSSQDRQMPPP